MIQIYMSPVPCDQTFSLAVFESELKPLSRTDLKTVRGVCLMNGTTLTHWLRDKGFSTDTAFNALLGRRNGPVSRSIREAVFSEFGL